MGCSGDHSPLGLAGHMDFPHKTQLFPVPKLPPPCCLTTGHNPTTQLSTKAPGQRWRQAGHPDTSWSLGSTVWPTGPDRMQSQASLL